ncbi:hypothetical protein Hanom_Chr03g00219571 [Helianthus anomalus]
MIENYQNCRKELESTPITCENWVESCHGYEMLLDKQIKSNVKLRVSFKKYDQEQETQASFDSKMFKIIPTTSTGEKINITETSEAKIILEKPLSSMKAETFWYKLKPTWSDEFHVQENFKPIDFTNLNGIDSPNIKIIPLTNSPTNIKTSVHEKRDKGKERLRSSSKV